MINTKVSPKIDLKNLPDENLVHNFVNNKKRLSKQMILAAVVIIIAGVISGYFLSLRGLSSTSTATGGKLGSGKAVGSADTKTFPDSAEGQLEAGGLNGEGTHKLIRPGGDNQTVYLTSSVLDLNQFVGKKVKIWGQTYSAQRAGWLMDVGRVEVL